MSVNNGPVELYEPEALAVEVVRILRFDQISYTQPADRQAFQVSTDENR